MAVVLTLADTGEDPESKDGAEEGDEGDDEAEQKETDDDAPRQPIDFHIELVDDDGDTSSLPLSAFGHLAPPPTSKFTKLPIESFIYGDGTEPTLQTFELPLERFFEQNPSLDIPTLSQVRLIFDGSEKGLILLDDVGFSTL